MWMRILSFLLGTSFMITSAFALEERVNIYTRFAAGDNTIIMVNMMIKQLNKKYEGVYDFRVNIIPGSGGESADQRAILDANAGINTLVVGSISNFAINPIVYDSKINRDIEFIPVELAHRLPNAIMVNPDLNINTVDDLVKHIRNKNKAYSGNTLQATSPILLDSIFRTHYGLNNVESVKYKAPPEVAKSVLINEVDYSILNPIDTTGLKLLAISFPQRDAYFPNIPTGIESGMPDFNYASSMMFYVPKASLKFVATIRQELHQACLDSYGIDMVKTLKITPICNNDETFLWKEITRERLLALKHKDSLK